MIAHLPDVDERVLGGYAEPLPGGVIASDRTVSCADLYHFAMTGRYIAEYEPELGAQ